MAGHLLSDRTVDALEQSLRYVRQNPVLTQGRADGDRTPRTREVQLQVIAPEQAVTFTADATTDLITPNAAAPGPFDWPNGAGVRVLNVGGALPAPLAVNIDYFVTKMQTGPVKFQLALTPAGTPINLTTAGSGTNYLIVKDRLAATVMLEDVKAQEWSQSEGVCLVEEANGLPLPRKVSLPATLRGSIDGTPLFCVTLTPGKDWNWYRQTCATPLNLYYTGVSVFASGVTVGTITPDNMTAIPLLSVRGGFIDKLGLWLAQVGDQGAKVRLAIYEAASDTDLRPTTLVVDSGDLNAYDPNSPTITSVSSGTPGLLSGGGKMYAISALLAHHESAESNAVEVTSPLLTYGDEGWQATLSWSTVTGATAYNVYTTEDVNPGNFSLLACVTGTSFVDDGTLVPDLEQNPPLGAKYLLAPIDPPIFLSPNTCYFLCTLVNSVANPATGSDVTSVPIVGLIQDGGYVLGIDPGNWSRVTAFAIPMSYGAYPDTLDPDQGQLLSGDYFPILQTPIPAANIPAPVVHFTAPGCTSAAALTCAAAVTSVAGTTVTYGGTAAGGVPPYVWQWFFGPFNWVALTGYEIPSNDGTGFSFLGQSALQNPTFHFPVAGQPDNYADFVAILLVTDSVGQQCMSQASVALGVLCTAYAYMPPSPNHNTPYPPIGTALQTAMTVELGAPVGFLGEASQGTWPYTWSWSFGSTTQNAAYTFGAVGTFTETLTVTDYSGNTCSSHVVITVIDTLTCSANAYQISGTPLVVQFLGGALAGLPPYTWAWDFGDGVGTSTLQNPQYTYATDSTFTATLTVTDAGGATCTSSVVISGILACGALATPTSGTAPLAVSFTGTASGGTSPYTWYWDFGDGNNASTQNPSNTYAAWGNYTAQLTVTDSASNTCIAYATVNVAPLTWGCDMSLSMPPWSPGGGVSGSASISITLGSAVTMTAAATGGITGAQVASYLWDFGDGNTQTDAGGALTDTVNYTYTAPGTFTPSVGIVAVDGTTCAVPFVTVYVADPTMTCTAAGSPAGGYSSLAVSFTATVSGGTSPYTWHWDFGDGNSASTQNPSNLYATGGAYTATMIVTDAFGDTCSQTVVTFVAGCALGASVTLDMSGWSGNDTDGNDTSSLNGTFTLPYSSGSFSLTVGPFLLVINYNPVTGVWDLAVSDTHLMSFDTDPDTDDCTGTYTATPSTGTLGAPSQPTSVNITVP